MPKKPPKTIRVGPINYKVLFVNGLKDDNGNNLLGQQDHTHAVIGLRTDLQKSPDVLLNTLLHELLHALWKNAELPEDNEERAVSLLANGLQSLLVDNPKFLEMFRNGN